MWIATLEKRFSAEKSEEDPVSFLFPKNWKGSWNGNAFSATLPGKSDTDLRLKVESLQTKDFQDLLDSHFDTQIIKSKGILKKETVNEGIWMEQSIAAEKEGQLYQYLFVLYQDPISKKEVQLVLSNPWGSFSLELQEMMMYFQKSVHF